MKKLFKRSVWTLLTVFFALIMAIVIVASYVVLPFSFWIDDFFDVTRYVLVDDGDSENQDTQYFKSDYAVKDENGNLVLTTNEQGLKKQTFDNIAMREHSEDVAERVVEEGSVLLWNKNNALPLEKGAKISNFGVTSTDWNCIGVGSGGVSLNTKPELKSVFESRGLQINDTLISALKTGARLGYGISLYDVKEMPWNKYSASAVNSISSYGDAAVFTVSRYLGEGGDASNHVTTSDDGYYLSFSRDECSVIEGLLQLRQEGKIKKIILVINSANAMSLNYIKNYDIDACLWVGYGGTASLDGLADLLVGNANPSGHLTDTWVYDAMSVPANQNFGNFTFSEMIDGVPESGKVSNEKINAFVVYKEGIYVGYRYYETRYEDTVLGGRKADSTAGVKAGSGNWSYGDEVAYTFGYGASYTTFEYSDYSVKKSGTDYEITMTIKNTGDVAGKEVMQIYLQKPYTEYDVKNHVEKSAVELVGFEKTKLLESGESQTLTVTVSEYEFKSYDSYGAGTYILEKGDYYLAAGKDAHDALNNILAAKGYTAANGMDADGDKNLSYKITYSNDDFETYSVSPFTGAKIENQFDNADINRYDGMAGQSVTYLSRSNWEATYPTGTMLACNTEIIAKDLSYERDVENNPDDEMPIYDTVTSKYGKLSLIQLMDVPYNDPLWDDLLNQMTFEEQVDFVKSCAGGGAGSIAAPGDKQGDGPCGLDRGSLSDLDSRMAFPCNAIVASTFNKELAEELGEAFGNEMLHYGYTALYGLTANIHRSAFCGRNYEYYSEDGFLSGAITSAESKGLRNKGIMLFTKHFALNDMETNRQGVTTWANEQSIREIYLKAFETGITDGYTNGLMTSFNRIGAVWSGLHKGLLTNVLRGEWGFIGITITDACGTLPYMGGTDSIHAAGLIAGQDAWMGNMTSTALDQYKDNATVCLALRETAHRIAYTQLHSASMNGVSSNTHVEYVTPAWEKAIVAAEIASGVLAALCLGMTAVCWILWYKEKRRNAENK